MLVDILLMQSIDRIEKFLVGIFSSLTLSIIGRRRQPFFVKAVLRCILFYVQAFAGMGLELGPTGRNEEPGDMMEDRKGCVSRMLQIGWSV